MASTPRTATPTSKSAASSPEEQNEECVPDGGGVWRLMREHGQGTILFSILGTLGSLSTGTLAVIFFWYFANVFDPTSALETESYKELAVEYLATFLILGFANLVFYSLQYISWGIFGAKISARARKEYFQSLLRQDVGYYDEKNSGAMNTELLSDCMYIAVVGRYIGLAQQHTVTFIGSFILAFTYSWRFALLLLVVVPYFAGLGAVLAYFQNAGTGGEDAGKEVDPKAAAGAFSNEVFLSIRAVKSVPCLLQQKLREFSDKLADLLPFTKKQALGVSLGAGGFPLGMSAVLFGVGFGVGGKWLQNDKIEILDMLMCLFNIGFGAMSLGQIVPALSEIGKARLSANKLFALQDRKPRIKEPELDSAKQDPLRGAIEFKNVSFSYPTAPDTVVLDELSFTIESGQTLAIVGPSGSGKSTVINLLERYYDPTGGEVLMDGERIHNFDIEHLRRSIGYVSQLPLLFAESIMENIRGGNPNISDDDVIAAAKMADAHDFITKLDAGYNTNVGEMGNRLSGGQKQRIAIARAVATNPAILLLDEATSALDTKSEREVQRAIDNIAANSSQTIVVIAHRLSTIKNADKIIVLVDGDKEEEGDHQSLIEQNGLYAVLVREQQVTDANRADDGSDAENKEKVVVHRAGINITTPTLSPLSGEFETVPMTSNAANEQSIVAVTSKEAVDEKKDGDHDDSDKEEKDKVPDLGGTKRLAAEYAQEFQCEFYFSVILSLIGGALECFVWAYLFPESLEILYDPDASDFDNELTMLILKFVIVGICNFVCTSGGFYLFIVYAEKLTSAVKRDWFALILEQEVAYHDEKGSAALNSELTVETQAIALGMGAKVAEVMQCAGKFLVGFSIAFWKSWEMTLVMLGLLPFVAIGGAAMGKIYDDSGENADPFVASGAVSQEILTNIRTVLAFPDLVPSKTAKYEGELAKGLPTATKRAAGEGAAHGLFQFCLNGVMYGAAFFIGYYMIDAGWIDYYAMINAFLSVLIGGMGLGQGLGAMAALQTAKLAANKFFVIKQRVPVIRKPTDLMDPIKSHSPLNGRIGFKNVSFSYQTAPNVKVLDDVSFDVPAGSSLAIVGPSGSGKSTIISLIERFYDYQGGSIVMDGSHPINDYDLSYLRSSIGLVSQMPLLFDTTITENIRGGLMTATKEDIEEAAKSANAHDFIMKLDEGYETKVGELGGKLSGGQRQRIAIARALLAKPSILLLDEATSALDSKSEKEVQSAIDAITARGQQTTITIAHRLNTIKNSDNILVLVDGKVKESGNHHQLMEEQGVYSALVNAQSLVEEKKELHRQKSHPAAAGDLTIEVQE